MPDSCGAATMSARNGKLLGECYPPLSLVSVHLDVQTSPETISSDSRGFVVGGDNLFECCGCILGPCVNVLLGLCQCLAIVRQCNSVPTIWRPKACTASIPRSDVPPLVMWKVTTAVSDLCTVRAGNCPRTGIFRREKSSNVGCDFFSSTWSLNRF